MLLSLIFLDFLRCYNGFSDSILVLYCFLVQIEMLTLVFDQDKTAIFF